MRLRIYNIIVPMVAILFLLPVGAQTPDSLVNLRSEESLASALYKDPTAPVADRAQDLLRRMTIDEKIGQMILTDWRYLSSIGDISTFKMGALLGGGGSGPQPNVPQRWSATINSYQRIAQETLLEIPLLIGNDAVHGVGNLQDATIFPHHIGLGATNDPTLVARIAAATAREARALGINWNYSPAVSVPQDIRWGRTYEGFSSDPIIVSRLGAAEIRGMQQEHLLATAKHFVADGGTSLGKDRGNAKLDDATLYAVHLPPYQAAINAGVEVIMASYSSINGVKMHQQEELLSGLLKGEMGFKGFIVSDWEAIRELPGSLDNQAALAVNAGIDMIMEPTEYQPLAFALQRQVANGTISAERLDDAVLRILTAKFHAGLFESAWAQRDLQSQIRSPAHLELAREAVRRSAVLLKNQEAVLPFSPQVRSILLVGTHADDIGAQCGGWTIEWQGRTGAITAGSSILDGFRKRGGADFQIDFAPTTGALNKAEGTYDVIVAVVGEDPYAEGVGDSVFPRISAHHVRLLKKAKTLGVPLVTIIISGRPLILREAEELSDAIVAAWLPGSEGGDGIAQLLWGDYPFQGRLPYQWPADRRAFRHGQGGPLYPLGFGL